MAQAPDPRAQAGQKVVEELKVSAHLMTLDAGVFCVFHAPGSQLVDPESGLPGVRVSLPPDGAPDVTIRTFREDGWIGANEGAALVRVPEGSAKVLITIYQRPGATEPAPKIQIQQLSAGSAGAGRAVSADAPARGRAAAPDTAGAEIAAHIQRSGDVVAPLGDWMGERGSQRWIEGFSIAPKGGEVRKEDIEYQAVLGRGWLSPWADGGQYCGSRGMALPILGLRVRLKDAAAATHEVRVSATFTDGTSVGPVDGTRACEAESLAPLEAFLVEFVPAGAAEAVSASPERNVPVPAPAAAPAAAPRRPTPAPVPAGAKAAPVGRVRTTPVAPARPGKPAPAPGKRR